jgi:hypothetical protein
MVGKTVYKREQRNKAEAGHGLKMRRRAKSVKAGEKGEKPKKKVESKVESLRGSSQIII